jgi:hypothetical protein
MLSNTLLWKREGDTYWSCKTPIGTLWIRMTTEQKVIAMYTIFENTTKFLPDEKWDGDPEIAKLFLEERYNIKRNLMKSPLLKEIIPLGRDEESLSS